MNYKWYILTDEEERERERDTQSTKQKVLIA